MAGVKLNKLQRMPEKMSQLWVNKTHGSKNLYRLTSENCYRRGEWEFEKLNKITQYRHNINTSIKKRVILSFYNVSCSLSDTWFAGKWTNIFFTRPTNIFFHFWFDVFFNWFFYEFWFFSIQFGSLAKMRRKNPSVPKNHFSAPSKSNCAHTLV